MRHQPPFSREYAVLAVLEAVAPHPVSATHLSVLTGISPGRLAQCRERLLARGRIVPTPHGDFCLAARGHEPAGQKSAFSALSIADDTPFLLFLRLQRTGERLSAVQALLDWFASAHGEAPRALLALVAEPMLDSLQRMPLRVLSEPDLRRYIGLCLNAQPLMAFHALFPRRMQMALLRARAAAFMLGDVQTINFLNAVYELHSMLDPRGVPYRYLSNPTERGTGLVGISGDWRAIVRAAPYLGTYNYMLGNPRLALDQFALPAPAASDQEQAGSASDIYAPYEALSAGLIGDFHLAEALLRTLLRRKARVRDCAERRMLRIYLSFVLLAVGKKEEALEQIDAAMTGLHIQAHLPGYMLGHVALALYHLLSGRPREACLVLYLATARPEALEYVFPLFLPNYLDMLYALHLRGFDSMPGRSFESELARALHGPNVMLRAVALRIHGDQLSRAGASAPRASAPLLESREVFKASQAGTEKAKTCAILAQFYLKHGDRKYALRYAVEAWPFYEQFHRFSFFWPAQLRDLMPEPDSAGAPSQAPESLPERCARSLLELDPYEHVTFLQNFIQCISQVFGAVRACLLQVGENDSLRLLAGQRITQREIEDGEFSRQRKLIHASREGIPIYGTLEPRGAKVDGPLFVLCLPILHTSSLSHVLYLDGSGWRWSEEHLAESALAHAVNLASIPLRRFFKISAAASASAAERAAPVQEFITRSPLMLDMLRKADLSALSGASIMLYGESGVGKELVARRIHEKSGRKGPFVAVNLSSLPEELFESEMQGYERGAFTGAFQKRIGLMETAHRGTLFIDELPDTSPRVQVKLLRLLQERSFMRLGSTQIVHSDFRLIVATNKNLPEAIRSGGFRPDLFYRICVVPLHIPPLRERGEDIPVIARHYLHLFAKDYGRPVPNFSPEDFARLLAYPWPGNVRELKNTIERAVILGLEGNLPLLFDSDSVFSSAPLCPPADVRAKAPPVRMQHEAAPSSLRESLHAMFSGLPKLRELEEMYIQEVLRVTDGKLSGRHGAAGILGITRSTLHEKIKRSAWGL